MFRREYMMNSSLPQNEVDVLRYISMIHAINYCLYVSFKHTTCVGRYYAVSIIKPKLNHHYSITFQEYAMSCFSIIFEPCNFNYPP